ncbi:sensor histidine kinase [Fodinibius halophilus]|uniref:histidine kinase n=1 Tax=Fodinibius halophilus TaxID=1736908 RepID=A0A6M1STZ3_9BACT|nr:HAMP domain-containing sensor histidine kinase [Fodinibius halophilus]NGP87408.1 HAMP domain-containing histidine kinase [Fodinibius halophilus]
MVQTQNAIELSGLMEETDNNEPSFIIDIDNRKVCEVNDKAIALCNNHNPVGEKLNSILHIDKAIGRDTSPAFFNGEWFCLEQETLLWNGSPHIKVLLKEREEIPSIEAMQSLKKMVGFLLHRIRSPLTGIQGYTGMIANQVEQQQNQRYLNQVDKGIDQLFDILDELESLEEISLDPVALDNHSSNPEKVINDILSGYSEARRDKITFAASSTNNVRCNPGDLQRILSILISNAVEHAPIEKHRISISQPSAHSIKISHNGNPIPKSIAKELFHPFVTTKAQKMGIGLTMAMLYAKRYRGSIFLTDNNPFREVSFTLCLPPTSAPYKVSL